MAPRVRVIDRGWNRIMATINSSDGWRAKVGLQSESGEHTGGITNVELGVIHEFGASPIPERSFIRSAFDTNKSKYMRLFTRSWRELSGGRSDGRTQMGIIAEVAVADIINGINRGIPPVNSEKTIAAKGSSKPLIDTSQLKQANKPKVYKR